MSSVLNKPLFLLTLCTCLLAVSGVRAAKRSCFQLPNSSDKGSAKESSTRRVTLASRVETQKGCEYALDPSGPWMDLSPIQSAAEEDFIGLVQLLNKKATSSTPSHPTRVFARKKRAKKQLSASNLESVFLASCSEFLLSDGRGFNLSVPVETQKPSISRIHGQSSCDASQLSLRFVPTEYDQTLQVIRKGPWTRTLNPNVNKITLNSGGWAIYAARESSPNGYLVGRIYSESSLTPLRIGMQSFVAHSAEKPWLRATWEKGPLRFEPTSEAFYRSDSWAELRTAAAADSLWLAKRHPSSGELRALGRLMVSKDGESIALPSQLVQELMQQRYGDVGNSLVPTFLDWKSVRQGLEVCLASRYIAQKTSPTANGSIPTGSTCVALEAMAEPFNLQLDSRFPSGRLCVRRFASLMTASGPQLGPELDEVCMDLGSSTAAPAPSDFIIATTSDTLRFTGTSGSKLFVCTDNRCVQMPKEGPILLDTPGLIEVRLAESRDRANSVQGLTLLRLGVIDPATEWHPTGLYTSEKTPPPNRWTMLAYDESEVFSYIRRTQQLNFRLSTSKTLTSAWNARHDLPTQITQEIPIVGGVKGAFPGTKPATFAALVTRNESCPEVSAKAFRELEKVDPDDLLIDQVFYVHLAQYMGEDKPYRCVSKAIFRVAGNYSISATNILRFGFLGDTQAVMFLTREPALGLAFPLGYGYLRLLYGFGVDASLSLTAASTLLEEDPLLTRAGLSLSLALVWGPEMYAPRLFSFGGMLHATTGTDDEPLASLYLGLNLSTLLDMAGGR